MVAKGRESLNTEWESFYAVLKSISYEIVLNDTQTLQTY